MPHPLRCARAPREDRQPSVFRLVSEHDGRLLLVARQRWAGEGDFFIFAYPDDDDGGGDDDYKDGGGGGGDRGWRRGP